MKILRNLAQWLFILCLPLLLLSASIGWAVNSLWLYEYGFHKYNVGATTGLDDSQLHKAAVGVISYFNSGEEYITLTVEKNGETFELFNQREIIHLKDVKGLIRLDYWVLLGTLMYTLGYAGVSFFWRKPKYRRRLASGAFAGSSLTLGLMLALGIGVLVGFNQLFLLFHLISFSNDLWVLDPTRDYMIMLFPGGFWYDVFLLCALATALGAVILGGVAGRYLLLTRRKTLLEKI